MAQMGLGSGQGKQEGLMAGCGGEGWRRGEMGTDAGARGRQRGYGQGKWQGQGEAAGSGQ